MNYLDTLFRAFTEYRKYTTENHECERQRELVSKTDAKNDLIEIVNTRCIIDEDWIIEIEKGLVYVEKAIKEERQFIRSNGEVVPIEKAKRVSKDSVEHLARHSNLLTKKPEEGKDIIPDQIYTVERLSDYAVYENRFLYMLLCYLRDFISLRYNKILELTNTYTGSMTMSKNIASRSRNIKFSATLEEEKKDDEYLKTHNEAKDIISRIDLILKAVMVFLSTPLMDQVSKSPMLKPPITKTNVLKMNHNFKNAVALYEFLTSYDKDGYTVEKKIKRINPFNDELGDELAEAVLLSSFITYEHGLGIKEYLKESYDQEEKRLKEEKEKELLEQIRKLKRRIQETGLGAEEYMLLLEKRNRALEDDRAALIVARAEIERLTTENEELSATVQTQAEEIIALNEKYEKDTAELKLAHRQEVETLTEKHTQTVLELNAKHSEEKRELKEGYEYEIGELKSSYENQIATLSEPYEERISALNEEIESNREAYEDDVRAIKVENAVKIKEINRLADEKVAESDRKMAKNKAENDYYKAQYEKMYEKARFTTGRLNALRHKLGLIHDPDEFTSKEAFDEIEMEYALFKKFFATQWRRTKKKIKKEIFKKDEYVEKKANEVKEEVLPPTILPLSGSEEEKAPEKVEVVKKAEQILPKEEVLEVESKPNNGESAENGEDNGK